MTRKKLRSEAGSESVDAYISRCPKSVQAGLRAVRAAIREVAPDATETTSYFDIPGYSYPGYDYNGMFVWFSFQKTGIGLHLRPPVVERHTKELAGYPRTKSIVRFPPDQPVPVALVKRLVTASLNVMRAT